MTCSTATAPACNAGVCGAAGCESPKATCGNACCSVYGNPTSLGGTGTYTGGTLCVRPVTVGAAGDLVDIGVIGITPGIDVVFGLYADNGGTPGALVAETGESVLVNGPLLLATPATPVSAASYWIAVEFNGTASVVESPTTTVTAYCATLTFSPTLPAAFPAETSYSGRMASWYVLVE